MSPNRCLFSPGNNRVGLHLPWRIVHLALACILPLLRGHLYGDQDLPPPKPIDELRVSPSAPPADPTNVVELAPEWHSATVALLIIDAPGTRGAEATSLSDAVRKLIESEAQQHEWKVVRQATPATTDVFQLKTVAVAAGASAALQLVANFDPAIVSAGGSESDFRQPLVMSGSALELLTGRTARLNPITFVGTSTVSEDEAKADALKKLEAGGSEFRKALARAMPPRDTMANLNQPSAPQADSPRVVVISHSNIDAETQARRLAGIISASAGTEALQDSPVEEGWEIPLPAETDLREIQALVREQLIALYALDEQADVQMQIDERKLVVNFETKRASAK